MFSTPPLGSESYVKYEPALEAEKWLQAGNARMAEGQSYPHHHQSFLQQAYNHHHQAYSTQSYQQQPTTSSAPMHLESTNWNAPTTAGGAPHPIHVNYIMNSNVIHNYHVNSAAAAATAVAPAMQVQPHQPTPVSFYPQVISYCNL